MSAQTQNEIFVPALVSEGVKTIIPDFYLGDAEYRKDKNNAGLTSVAYNEQMQLPTLAELRHAYFGRLNGQEMGWHSHDIDGELRYFSNCDDWTSPKYRKDVLSNQGTHEWTATYLQDGKYIIDLLDAKTFTKGTNEWLEKNLDSRVLLKKLHEIIERSGKNFIDLAEKDGSLKIPLRYLLEFVVPFEPNTAGYRIQRFDHIAAKTLPEEGWVLEYDRFTGFPSRTSHEKEDAEKIFGNDASYFFYNHNGLIAVMRNFTNNSLGPFYILANYGPEYRDSDVGGRSCHRINKV
ncbi:MAG: hypothetical protein V1802_02090 [Candidatus Aenigmatarchaeota archaeon]